MSTFCLKNIKRATLLSVRRSVVVTREIVSKSQEKQIQDCYKLLNIPLNSKQDVVKSAFLELAKKYHPDSGSSEADMDKFVEIERAFRTLSKHNTGSSKKEEVEQMIFDIRHTAPQHRQYLSFEGFGYGTPFQRQKQWTQARATKAAANVLEHRIAKAVASENTLMKKGQYSKKHDIKTKYGFDRLVEDLIQESMSKGAFENLSGKGKPLKDQNTNPYVDFTTHKINEVLINNGFTPEWITMTKEIDQDIQLLKNDIKSERKYLGPWPLNDTDNVKWEKICESNKYVAKNINSKITKFNLIVPLIDKQKFLIKYDEICNDILKNGEHSVTREKIAAAKENVDLQSSGNEDLITGLFKGLCELLSIERKSNKN